MSVKERLTRFVAYKQRQNKAEGLDKFNMTVFCLSIGVSKAFVSSMRESVSQSKLESIALKYPELNIYWLLTGTGEMLNSSPAIPEKNESTKSETINDQILELLQNGELYPALYVKNLQEQRDELLKQNAVLEERLKEVEKIKTDAPPDENVKCAGVG